MTRSILILALSALVAGLACLPEPLDETGKLCSAERPCGPDHHCVSNVCVRPGSDGAVGTEDGGKVDGGEELTDAGDLEDAGVPDAGGPGPLGNLLVNGDFEQADGGFLPGWRTTPFDSAYGMSMPTQTPFGARAALIYVTSPSTSFSLAPSNVPVADAGAAIYCAAAWFKGEDAELRLQIREGPGADPEITESAPVVGARTWQELRVVRQTTTFGPVDIRVVGDVRSETGVYIDNVELWRSTSMECDQR